MVSYRWFVMALAILLALFLFGCNTADYDSLMDTRGHLFGHIKKTQEEFESIEGTNMYLINKIQELETRIQVLEAKLYAK